MTRWLCAALAILALLTGCSSGTQSQPLADAAAAATEPGRDVPLVDEPLPVMPAPTPQLPVTVESADGPTVEVADASRILPLSGGVAEVVYLSLIHI